MAKPDFFTEACKQHHTKLQESVEKTDNDIFSVRRRPQTSQLLRANVERHTKLLQTETTRTIKHEDCCGYCERYCEGKITPNRHSEIEAWTRSVNQSMLDRQRSANVLRKQPRYPNYHPPGAPTNEKGFRLVPTPKSMQRKQLDFSAHSLMLIKQAVAAVKISPYVSQECLNLQRDPCDTFNFECCYETVTNGLVERQDTEKCNNIDNNSADFDDKLSVTESSSKEHDDSHCDSDLSTMGHAETSQFVIHTDQTDIRHPPSPSGELLECDTSDMEPINAAGWCLIGHGYTRPANAQQSIKIKNMSQDQSARVSNTLDMRNENDSHAAKNTHNRPVSANRQTVHYEEGKQAKDQTKDQAKDHMKDQMKIQAKDQTKDHAKDLHMYQVKEKDKKTEVPQCVNTAVPSSEQRESAEKGMIHLVHRPQSSKVPMRNASSRMLRRASVHNLVSARNDQDKSKVEHPMRPERYANITRWSSTPLATRPMSSRRPVSHNAFTRRVSQIIRARPSTAPPRFTRTNKDIPSKALNIMLTSRDVLQNNAYRGLFKYDSSLPLQTNIGSKRFQQMNRALVDMVEQGDVFE